MTSAVTSDFFSTLEARGFGGLTNPAPAEETIQVPGPGNPFSYFTYEIQVGQKQPNCWDETWSSLPIDGVWGFMKASGVVAAGPCMLHLCENSDGSPARPSEALARHWCTVLFDDDSIPV